MEDKLLLSEFVFIAGLSTPFHKTPAALERTADQPPAESEQAPFALQSRSMPASHETLTRQLRGDMPLFSDPDIRQSDPDDGAISESPERHLLAMLAAVSQAGLAAHPLMAAPEAGRAKGAPSELPPEPLLQPVGVDATHHAAGSATAVNTTEGPLPAVPVWRPMVPGDFDRNAPSLPSAEIGFDLSDLVEPQPEPCSRLLRLNDSSFAEPLAGTPAAGLPPFDFKAVMKSMDSFLAQLTDLGKSWDDPRRAITLALWLTTVTALAFELARLQARKSLSRTLLESGLPGPALPPAGDDP